MSTRRTDKSLTILLTLKDRIPFTFRWMSYANRINFPFKVLIADGGADETVPKILSNRASFPNVDCEYVRYPYDQTYAEYFAKVADVLSRIETPFVAMVDNDDFFIVDGLRRSVDFFRVHPDYSSCRGAIGWFWVGSSDKYGHSSRVYGEDISFIVHQDQSTMGETAAQRVWSHFLCYSQTRYNVHRTEQLKTYFQTLADLDFKDLWLAEFLTSFLTVAAGEVRRAPYLYLVRQANSPGSSARTAKQKWGDWFDRMLLESWSGDFTKFVNAIATAVSSKDGTSVDDARRQVKQGYRMHAAPHIRSCLLGQNTEPSNLIVRMAESSVHKLYLVIRKITSDRSKTHGEIPIDRSSEYYEDTRPIYDFLTAQPPYDALKGVERCMRHQ